MSLETDEPLNFVEFASLETKIYCYICTKKAVQNNQGPLTDMEVVDLEKKSLEDTMEEHGIYETNDRTAELDTNGEEIQGDVDEFRQNHWQFSDEGKREEFGR